MATLNLTRSDKAKPIPLLDRGGSWSTYGPARKRVSAPAPLPQPRPTGTAHRDRRFKQKDIERAVKAAMKAGVTIGRVEIRADGALAIYPKGEGAGDPAQEELDREYAEWRKSHANN